MWNESSCLVVTRHMHMYRSGILHKPQEHVNNFATNQWTRTHAPRRHHRISLHVQPALVYRVQHVGLFNWSSAQSCAGRRVRGEEFIVASPNNQLKSGTEQTETWSHHKRFLPYNLTPPVSEPVLATPSPCIILSIYSRASAATFNSRLISPYTLYPRNSPTKN